MTPNQRLFADEYIKTRNATQAYLKAYPNCKNDNTAHAAAARMLRNVTVSQYIDEQLDKLHNRSIADAAEIMQYFTSVMRGEIKEQMVTDDGDIVDIDTKTTDRTNAAKELAKMLGVDKGLDRERFEYEKQKDKAESGMGDSTDRVVIVDDV